MQSKKSSAEECCKNLVQRNFLHLGEIPNSSEEVQQVRLEEVRWKSTKLHEGVDETEKPGSIFKMLILWLGQ